MSAEGLVVEAREFVRALASGRWFGGWIWEDERGDFAARGDPGWAPAMDALLTRADTAFAEGSLEEAAATWAILLPALRMRDAYGGCAEPEELLTHDLRGALARWCRVLAATGPAVQRGHKVAHALRSVCPHAPLIDLRHIREAAPTPPPDWSAWLGRLKGALLQSPIDPPAWQQQRRHLLLQLPRGEEELQILADRARASGDRLAWEDWIDALAVADRVEEALAAAEEALAQAPDGESAAVFADAAARHALALDLHHRVTLARRRAFHARPDGPGFLRLLAASEDEALTLSQELERAWAGHAPLPERLVVGIELLQGELEGPVARLQGADPALWEDPDHPGPLVLPLLLRAGMGRVRPPTQGPLATAWQRVGEALPGPAEGQGIAPAPSFADALERALPRWPHGHADAPWCRAIARAEILRRVEAIARSADRSAYEEAALWVVAWAELTIRTGDRPAGQALLTEISRRWPRHKALHARIVAMAGELGAAA